jgi:hypothetical protein
MPHDKIDVCYLISHGFAARMVFQSGLIEKLNQAGNSVAIISPDINDPNLVKNCLKHNVSLFAFPKLKNRDAYLKFRKYLLEDVKNNPALYAKHLRNIKSEKSTLKNKLVSTLSYFLNRLIIHLPFIKKLVNQYEKSILKSSEGEALLHKINPGIVVATYPVNFQESVILSSSNRLNIKTCIHLLSWDNITSKGIFFKSADYYIAWGPIMAEELKEFYNIKDKNIFITGVAHFDNHIRIKNKPNYKTLLKDLNLNPDHPYIFFGMSSPYFNPREIDIIEWLADGINSNSWTSNLQMVVRPHPQNIQNHGGLADQSWIQRLKKIECERIKINYPLVTESNLPWSMKDEDMDNLSNLLTGCSVCLNSTSTISIDGLIHDKPVILTSFDGKDTLPWWEGARRVSDYTHYNKFLKCGGIEVVRSFNELFKSLEIFLNNPDKNRELRKLTLFRECGIVDGNSTQRISDTISILLKSKINKRMQQLVK